MISGGGSGVGVGGDESPPTATSPKAAHEEEGGQEGQVRRPLKSAGAMCTRCRAGHIS